MNKEEFGIFIKNVKSSEIINYQEELPRLYKYLTNQTSIELVALIENSGLFEKHLLPEFNGNSSFEQLFLILLIINYKVNQKINVWEHFRNQVEKFNLLFEKVTNIDLLSLQSYERPVYINFLIICFQNFEEKFIQNLCFKLVSMALWLRLSKDSIKKLLLQYMSKEYINKWRKISEIAKEIYNSKPCVFMHNLVDSFLKIIENDKLKNSENVFFYEKFIEFMIDLLSQIPTRRFFLPILKEKHFIERCSISTLSKVKNDSLFNKMIETMKFYVFFDLNEENGESLNQNQILLNHYENINKMQANAYEYFPEKLSRVLLKNVSMIDNRTNIKEMLDELNDEEVYLFAKKLKLLNFPKSFYSKELIYEVFIQQFIRKESKIDTINKLSLYPTEKLIWDNSLIPDEYTTGDKILPCPKLNLQFLTYYDYFLKNFNLYRYESTYEIRNELEDVIERVHTKFDKKGNFEKFEGWSRMAIPIRLLKFLSVKPAEIGKMHPCEVTAEIEINLNGIQQQLKAEWDELKKYDILFLIYFHNKKNSEELEEYTDIVKHVRGCEILKIFDEENNEITDYDNSNRKKPCGNKRKIHVTLDPIQYKEDIENKEFNIENVYSAFQLLVRRKPKENNFKAILETIRDLMNVNVKIPTWLENVILGYGDNKSLTNMNNNLDISQLDLKDTFIDMDHYEKTLLKNKNLDGKYKKIRPPGYLSNSDQQLFCFSIADIEIIKQNNTNKIKKNKIRFTENQVQSILSGLNNGLTLIIGPPGTGKTDVAVQIINLIYHNFPSQRTLIITRSNSALNDLFVKIASLDINERYLLRLGYGEKDLEVTQDYSKNGRVNYMLARRMNLLDQVNKLAKSIEILSHEEYTCESALNFYEIHIRTRINEYTKNLENFKKSGLIFDIETVFPFTNFFKINHFNNSVLFEKTSTVEDYNKSLLLIKFIENIFSEIHDCYAFELLRNSHERGNYLLTKQAKVIAMTSTYAALKRRDFISLGLEYDNVLIEESAQLLDIETFIPLVLQKTDKEISRLKRVIMIGDHYQLPPIIKNSALKSFCNMDQSMFNRLIRLEIPKISLNWQGRMRNTICDLIRWRYGELNDLPTVEISNFNKNSLYNYANTGFLYEYQFIDTPDFEGCGESAPIPYFYQNLAEAEYVVATYMFMVLLGYDPNKITILTTYNGQKALIKDIVKKRCSWSPLFRSPFKITTVDKYQGQQNDYILLSLVRTNYFGHLRDIRRLIVSMSRARLGLYVFGRYNIFRSCFELSHTMNIFSKKALELKIFINEVFPTLRKVNDDEIDEKHILTVKDFKHLYKIVEEIIKIKFITASNNSQR